MSHQKKIEQVLDLLINEEHDAASELLHSVIVEKARAMYEELVDEDFGGDAKEDFADEIAADKNEVEAEEIFDDEEAGDEEVVDGAVGAEDDVEVGEEEVEDRVEDLEAQLAELRAEFDALVGEESMEPEHMGDPTDGVVAGDVEEVDDVVDGDVDGDVDVEEGMYEEVVDGLDEATKLQDEVSVSLDKEGKLAGTGKNSKVGATNTESQFTKAPSKADHGGKPHPMNKGGDESGSKASQGKDNTPTSNIKVAQKNQNAKDVDGSDKGAKSTLGGKGSPTGK